MNALKSHYDNLQQKRAHLDKIIATVEKTIANKKGEIFMKDNEKFEGFKEKALNDNEQKYGEDIRKKYGDTVIDKSNKKFMGMSEEDYNAFTKLEEEINNLLPKAYKTGYPASGLAQELAAKHQAWLMYTWPNYSKEAHAGLAEMYVADESFTAYYDEHVKGGTKFLRDAIMVYVGKV